jgi:hypothetical protein
MLRAALCLAALLQLAACDQWHLSINSDGLVFVSVIGSGAEHRERFRVRTRGAGGTTRTLDVPASGELTLAPVAEGELQVALLSPEGCRVSGPNPLTVTVVGDQEVRLVFDVRCG